MNTSRLNKTNYISDERALIIESIIGIEITDVISQRKTTGLVVTPYDDSYSISKKLLGTKINNSAPYIIKRITFDYNTGVMTFVFRKRWQRGFSFVYGQGQPIGYKLPTTKVNEGFIWGNFNFSIK